LAYIDELVARSVKMSSEDVANLKILNSNMGYEYAYNLAQGKVQFNAAVDSGVMTEVVKQLGPSASKDVVNFIKSSGGVLEYSGDVGNNLFTATNGTGASGEIRLTIPNKYESIITSPMIIIFICPNFPKTSLAPSIFAIVINQFFGKCNY